MAPSRLRIYHGPDADTLPATLPLHDQVKLTLGEVLPLILDAVKSRRSWVDDFADDEISISTDLYEVLLAYQHFRRPSA